MIWRALVSAVLSAALLCLPGYGQLRIVQYNVAGLNNSSAFTTVVQAINDATINGVVKPIDAMILEEVDSSDISTIVGILNGMGNGTYASGQLGSTTGAGSVGLVYRTSTLELLSQQQVVNTSSVGAARGVMRYQLGPVGYDAGFGNTSPFFVYGSHYKASDTTSDAGRREVEATAIRANADALGEGAHVIYAGDFNIYRSTEPMWDTLTSLGNGQAFDPVNQVGNWHDSSAFKGVHTQNPAGSGGVGGGMDDRFDWQMVSGEMLDNEGLAMIAGSYQAFGNNGTHSLNGHINTGTGASVAVLNALGATSDHLPVVAQYQVPAKMGVEYPTNYQPRLIVGADVSDTAVVRNAANEPISVSPLVAIPAGADELDYTASGFGAFSGSYTGTDAAMGGWNTHSFQRDTATAGHKEGGIKVTTSSAGVPIPNNTIFSAYDVLDHANPSFSLESDVNELVVDFGTVDFQGSATMMFNITNLMDTPGFTASLDFDSVTYAGDEFAFETGLQLLEPSLAAGAQRQFTASMNTTYIGAFSATYFLNFSDEDLPGASLFAPLKLTLTGTIEVPAGTGDFDNDGDVDGRDFLVWQRDPNIGDLADWHANYGAGSIASAVAVPEPSAILLAIVLPLAVPRRLR